MPKDAPRKFKPPAPKKVADFAKVKTKLGKGKQVAQNATDTSYKARSIALPNQTIGVERDEGEKLTKGGKNWEELRVGSRHYNVAIRRDSILGMKELLLAHPDIRTAQLPSLFTTVCKTLTDSEASVRSLLPPLLSSVLPLLPSSTLTPHLPVLLLHSTSALSSIFPAVRVDAVRVLGVLLEESGGTGCERISEGWESGSGGRGEGGRVLEGLLAVLGVGGKGEIAGSNAPLNAASKLIVFQTLSKFLASALATSSSSGTSTDFSFLASSFLNHEAFDHLNATLGARSSAAVGKGKARAGDWAWGLGGWERGDLELDGSAHKGEEGVNRSQKIAELYLSLHSLLLSTFLDSAPTAFSPSAANSSASSLDVHLQMLSSITMLVSLLGLSTLRASPTAQTPAVRQALETMLKHMRVYFPFSEKTLQQRSSKDEAALVKMELDYASLTSLLAQPPKKICVPPRSKSDGPKDRAKAVEDAFKRARKSGEGKRKGVEEVAAWVVSLLKGERTTATSPLGVNVNRDTYLDLRECIWALLLLPPPGSPKKNVDPDEEREEKVDVPGLVLGALVDHHLRLASVDPIKKLGVEFIGRLCLLETEPLYTGLFRLTDASRARLDGFCASLPKVLWELRSKDLAATTTILRLVHSLLLSPLTSTTITPVLLASFGPYFHSHHPTRGNLPGPWVALPDADVKRLALDVARTALEGADEEKGERLSVAVSLAVGEVDGPYWTNITAAAAR